MRKEEIKVRPINSFYLEIEDQKRPESLKKVRFTYKLQYVFHAFICSKLGP